MLKGTVAMSASAKPEKALNTNVTLACPPGIELLDRHDQADVALLNQVQKLKLVTYTSRAFIGWFVSGSLDVS
jgi:hypothetical protein